ncbi:MAG: hypothetical protein ABJ327_02890 [Litoreibacter sp.]
MSAWNGVYEPEVIAETWKNAPSAMVTATLIRTMMISNFRQM